MNRIISGIWDFFRKNTKDLILVGLIAISYWLVYGLGQVVGIQGTSEEKAYAVGAKTIGEIRAMVDGGQSRGKLIIADQVKYKDSFGNYWVVSDFHKNISKGEMDFLRVNKVRIEGDVNMQLVNKSVGSKHAAFAAFMDGASRVILLLFYFVMIYFMFTQLKANGGFFGKPFKRVGRDGTSIQTTFADVAGHQGPKREIMEVVEYLRDPDKFKRTGARPPKGALLYGPPGNGKTLIAKAVAGEAQANYIEQNASSFMQMFVGMGAMRVRDLFKEARKSKPCVIFIDEIDSIGGHRGGSSGGHDERIQTINALLAELDGFENNDGIVVIAATNRLDNLDEALIRPGRFDRKIFIPLPGKADRREILDVHAKRLPTVTADMAKWAERSQGFSGADLANLVNEAAVEAARSGAESVGDAEFSKARDRILMGPRNHGHILTDREKRVTAYHEAGHACLRIIVCSGMLEKVSILPHGAALGVTVSGYDEERLLVTKAEIEKELVVMMGGRASEEAFVGEITSGAASDMERASQLARNAVLRYGFDAFGPYVPEGPELMTEVERSAAEWVKKSYDDAKGMLLSERLLVEAVVAKLLTDDEIDGDEIVAMRNSILAATLAAQEITGISADKDLTAAP